MVVTTSRGRLGRYKEDAKADMILNNRTQIRCPCQKCKLRTWIDPDSGQLEEHLLRRGFMREEGDAGEHHHHEGDTGEHVHHEEGDDGGHHHHHEEGDGDGHDHHEEGDDAGVDGSGEDVNTETLPTLACGTLMFKNCSSRRRATLELQPERNTRWRK